MSSIYLQIITPLGITFEGNVREVVVPTTSGMVTILPAHIPLISTIKSGELIVKPSGDELYFAVYAGVLEVVPVKDGVTRVVILANRSEDATNIDIIRAEEALKRAEQAMKEVDVSIDGYSHLEALMEKELNRVRVASKRKIM